MVIFFTNKYATNNFFFTGQQGKRRDHLHSSLPTPPAHEHSDIYLQFWFVNTSFHQKLKRIQYNACLAITGAIRGTSKEKLYY